MGYTLHQSCTDTDVESGLMFISKEFVTLSRSNELVEVVVASICSSTHAFGEYKW